MEKAEAGETDSRVRFSMRVPKQEHESFSSTLTVDAKSFPGFIQMEGVTYPRELGSGSLRYTLGMGTKSPGSEVLFSVTHHLTFTGAQTAHLFASYTKDTRIYSVDTHVNIKWERVFLAEQPAERHTRFTLTGNATWEATPALSFELSSHVLHEAEIDVTHLDLTIRSVTHVTDAIEISPEVRYRASFGNSLPPTLFGGARLTAHF